MREEIKRRCVVVRYVFLGTPITSHLAYSLQILHVRDLLGWMRHPRGHQTIFAHAAVRSVTECFAKQQQDSPWGWSAYHIVEAQHTRSSAWCSSCQPRPLCVCRHTDVYTAMCSFSTADSNASRLSINIVGSTQEAFGLHEV